MIGPRYVNNGFWFARAMSILSRSLKYLPIVANVLGSGTEGFGSLITRAKLAIIETGVLRVAG